MQNDEGGRATSPMLILERKDRTAQKVQKIMNRSGLEGVFSGFDSRVQKGIERTMRHILTKELQGLTPDEQLEKLEKMYVPNKKTGGRKRRRKPTKKRRRKPTKKRRKSRRRKRTKRKR